MTILNTIELTKTAPLINWISVGSIISLLLSFIIGMFSAGKGKRCDTIATCCFAMVILSFIGLFICAPLSDMITVPNGKYHYEITIDNGTSFAEVIEKYNIIEQRGEIFVVEEREDE